MHFIVNTHCIWGKFVSIMCAVPTISPHPLPRLLKWTALSRCTGVRNCLQRSVGLNPNPWPLAWPKHMTDYYCQMMYIMCLIIVTQGEYVGSQRCFIYWEERTLCSQVFMTLNSDLFGLLYYVERGFLCPYSCVKWDFGVVLSSCYSLFRQQWKMKDILLVQRMLGTCKKVYIFQRPCAQHNYYILDTFLKFQDKL